MVIDKVKLTIAILNYVSDFLENKISVNELKEIIIKSIKKSSIYVDDFDIFIDYHKKRNCENLIILGVFNTVDVTPPLRIRIYNDKLNIENLECFIDFIVESIEQSYEE